MLQFDNKTSGRQQPHRTFDGPLVDFCGVNMFLVGAGVVAIPVLTMMHASAACAETDFVISRCVSVVEPTNLRHEPYGTAVIIIQR